MQHECGSLWESISDEGDELPGNGDELGHDQWLIGEWAAAHHMLQTVGCVL